MSDRLNAATEAVYGTLVDGIDGGLAKGQDPALQLLTLPPVLIRTLATELASKALTAADAPRLILTVEVREDRLPSPEAFTNLVMFVQHAVVGLGLAATIDVRQTD